MNISETTTIDITSINDLITPITRNLFGTDLEINNLIEKSNVNITLKNLEGEAIANICLNDFPNIKSIPQDEWLEWMQRIYQIDGINYRNTLFIHFLVWSNLHQDTFLDYILQYVYKQNHFLKYIIFVIPQNTQGIYFVLNQFQSLQIQPEYEQMSFALPFYINCRYDCLPETVIALAELRHFDEIIDLITLKQKNVDTIYKKQLIEEIKGSHTTMDRICLVASIQDTTSITEDHVVAFTIINTNIDYATLQNQFDISLYTKLCSSVDVNRSAFAIEVFAVDNNHEYVITEILEIVFLQYFQDCDYCILSSKSLETSSILNHFNPIHPINEDIRTSNLYILNKDAVLGNITVKAIDRNNIKEIIEDQYEIHNLLQEIVEVVSNSVDENVYIIRINQNEVIGCIITSTTVNSQEIDSQFHIRNLCNYSFYKNEDQAIIKYFILSPLYFNQTRFIMKTLMQVAEISCLLYSHNKVYNQFQNGSNSQYYNLQDKISINFIKIMIPVRPRKYNSTENNHGDEVSKYYSSGLYFINKRISCQVPKFNHVKILIIGITQYTFGFLEDLFFNKSITEVFFTDVTLISKYKFLNKRITTDIQKQSNELILTNKGSINENLIENNVSYNLNGILDNLIEFVNNSYYNDEYIKKLGVDTKIKFIKGEITNINAKDKYITIDDNSSIIEFDYLFIFESMKPTLNAFKNLNKINETNKKINQNSIHDNTKDIRNKNILEDKSNINKIKLKEEIIRKIDSKIKFMKEIKTGKKDVYSDAILDEKITIEKMNLQEILNDINNGKYIVTNDTKNLTIKCIKQIFDNDMSKDVINQLETSMYESFLSEIMSEESIEEVENISDFTSIQNLDNNYNILNLFSIGDKTNVMQGLKYVKTIIENEKIECMDNVLIIGNLFNAMECAHSLLEIGSKKIGSKLILIEVLTNPYVSDCKTSIDSYVTKAMAEILNNFGIHVYKHAQIFDYRLNTEESSKDLVSSRDIVSVTFECLDGNTDSSLMTVPCSAVFIFEPKSIGHNLSKALKNAGVYVKDRILINNNYQTNVPFIYAAGDCIQYKYGKFKADQTHEDFNPVEIGSDVSRKFKQFIYNIDTQLIQYEQCLVKSYILPGGYYYLYVCTPGKRTCSKQNELKENLITIQTGSVDIYKSNDKYFQIVFNKHNIVQEITCLSPIKFNKDNIIQLYGKHNALLDNIIERNNQQPIEDLYEYFKQDWIMGIYYDKFNELMENINQLFNKKNKNGKTFNEIIESFYEDNFNHDYKIDNVIEKVENEFQQFEILNYDFTKTNIITAIVQQIIDYLKKYSEDLPMYVANQMIEKICNQVDENLEFYFKDILMANVEKEILLHDKNPCDLNKNLNENRNSVNDKEILNTGIEKRKKLGQTKLSVNIPRRGFYLPNTTQMTDEDILKYF